MAEEKKDDIEIEPAGSSAGTVIGGDTRSDAPTETRRPITEIILDITGGVHNMFNFYNYCHMTNDRKDNSYSPDDLTYMTFSFLTLNNANLQANILQQIYNEYMFYYTPKPPKKASDLVKNKRDKWWVFVPTAPEYLPYFPHVYKSDGDSEPIYYLKSMIQQARAGDYKDGGRLFMASLSALRAEIDRIPDERVKTQWKRTIDDGLHRMRTGGGAGGLAGSDVSPTIVMSDDDVKMPDGTIDVNVVGAPALRGITRYFQIVKVNPEKLLKIRQGGLTRRDLTDPEVKRIILDPKYTDLVARDNPELASEIYRIVAGVDSRVLDGMNMLSRSQLAQVDMDKSIKKSTSDEILNQMFPTGHEIYLAEHAKDAKPAKMNRVDKILSEQKDKYAKIAIIDAKNKLSRAKQIDTMYNNRRVFEWLEARASKKFDDMFKHRREQQVSNFIDYRKTNPQSAPFKKDTSTETDIYADAVGRLGNVKIKAPSSDFYSQLLFG